MKSITEISFSIVSNKRTPEENTACTEQLRVWIVSLPSKSQHALSLNKGNVSPLYHLAHQSSNRTVSFSPLGTRDATVIFIHLVPPRHWKRRYGSTLCCCQTYNCVTLAQLEGNTSSLVLKMLISTLNLLQKIFNSTSVPLSKIIEIKLVVSTTYSSCPGEHATGSGQGTTPTPKVRFRIFAGVHARGLLSRFLSPRPSKKARKNKDQQMEAEHLDALRSGISFFQIQKRNYKEISEVSGWKMLMGSSVRSLFARDLQTNVKNIQ